MSPEVFKHYKIGIPEVDDQHWAIINRLNNAVTVSDKDRKFANIMVKEVLAELKNHLKEEEGKMDTIRYPYAHAHKSAHKDLVQSLQEALNQMEAGFRYMSPSYILGRWQRAFLDHIDQHDVQLGNFIQRSI